MFMKADKNGNGTLDSKEVLKLVEEMNVKIDKDYAMEIFQVCYWLVSIVFKDYFQHKRYSLDSYDVRVCLKGGSSSPRMGQQPEALTKVMGC